MLTSELKVGQLIYDKPDDSYYIPLTFKPSLLMTHFIESYTVTVWVVNAQATDIRNQQSICKE